VESLFAASLHINDFVQTQNKAKILTEKKKKKREEEARINIEKKEQRRKDKRKNYLDKEKKEKYKKKITKCVCSVGCKEKIEKKKRNQKREDLQEKPISLSPFYSIQANKTLISQTSKISTKKE
jgi:hypothetical protein